MSGWSAKRFWKLATVEPTTEGFGILLDGRPVRTPLKATLYVPTKAAAERIAAEWMAQEDVVEPLKMPFTRAANAAIDKVGPQHAEVAEMLVEYGSTDLLCYRATGPAGLIKCQAEAWDPILDWARSTFGAPLAVTSGVLPVEQPATSLENLRREVHGLTAFELTAFHDLVALSGSLVVGLAALRGFMPVEALWEVSRIDEDWQVREWGEDDEASKVARVKKSDFLRAKEFLELISGETT